MKDRDDEMTAFERESLRLQQAAIDAQNRNTAAIIASREPTPPMQPREQIERLLAPAKAAAAARGQADYVGVGIFQGKCGEPSPPVNVRARFDTNGPRAGIAIEVNPDDAGRAMITAWCHARFDRENQQLVKEASADAERHAHYLKTRDRKCGFSYYQDFMLPLVRAVVGKTREQSSFAVKWAESPVWTSGPAETPAAPATEATAAAAV